MEEYRIKRWWLILLVVLPLLNMTAEYFININRISSSEEIPTALLILDELYIIWGPLLIGTILGFLISIIPVKKLNYSKRLVRSIVIGVLTLNLIFTLFYAYMASVGGLHGTPVRTVKRI